MGVTCVYGDVVLRGRMVRKLLTLAERPGVPVLLGVRETLLGQRALYWAGHEGVGLLDENDAEPDFGASTPSTFWCAPCWSGLARSSGGHRSADQRGPGVATRATAGHRARATDHHGRRHPRRGPARLAVCGAQHRVRPGGVQIVFAAGAPVYLVPLEWPLRRKFAGGWTDQCGRVAAPGAVAPPGGVVPGFRERGSTFLHRSARGGLVGVAGPAGVAGTPRRRRARRQPCQGRHPVPPTVAQRACQRARRHPRRRRRVRAAAHRSPERRCLTYLRETRDTGGRFPPSPREERGARGVRCEPLARGVRCELLARAQGVRCEPRVLTGTRMRQSLEQKKEARMTFCSAASSGAPGRSSPTRAATASS